MVTGDHVTKRVPKPSPADKTGAGNAGSTQSLGWRSSNVATLVSLSSANAWMRRPSSRATSDKEGKATEA
jgi:hypothetical protein